jgi:hypothetical protein
MKLGADAAGTIGGAFSKWLAQLKDQVNQWKQVAKATEIPEFDTAVTDLMAMQTRMKPVSSRRTPQVVGLKDHGIRKMEKVDSGIEL